MVNAAEMKIPKYVVDMMERSRFVLGIGDPGYTIQIRKSTAYTKIDTFKSEVDRLIKWCNRIPHYEDIPIAKLNRIENKTRYNWQYATVTIYDPLMKYLEKYIMSD